MASSRYGVGWVYNLRSPPKSTDAGQIIAIACAFSLLSVISVALRYAQRWKIVKAVGLDDLAAAASMVSGLSGTFPCFHRLNTTNNIPSFSALDTVRSQSIVSSPSAWTPVRDRRLVDSAAQKRAGGLV